tara:strand:- start:377 stop:673 length:297 start_codon:yes stop_codon:yes gene_type:complete
MKHHTTHSATSLIVFFMIALGFIVFLMHGYNVSSHRALEDRIQELEQEMYQSGMWGHMQLPDVDYGETEWRELTINESVDSWVSILAERIYDLEQAGQ